MESQILEFLKQGKTSELIALLEAEPEHIRFKDSNGVSLFLLSFYYGNKILSDYLSGKITDPDLYESAAGGNVERVQEWIQKEPQLIDSFSADGFTALGLASYFGRNEVARWLLEKNADPNIASTNSLKVAPIHSATSSRKLDIARLLLDAGADVNQVQQKNITPLHVAAHNGDLEMVKEYVRRGANTTFKSEEGKSAKDYALESKNDDVIAFFKSLVGDIAHEAST